MKKLENKKVDKKVSNKKFVYLFKEANNDKALFGGKGANLADMTRLGMPVPQGFIITTEACTQYYVDGRKINESISAQIDEKLASLEKIAGKKFGDVKNPLLVSVRSGARVSMPGMMDTILNLGLNDEVVEGLAALTGNPRFAYDSYRRFIQMFSDVVMMQSKTKYERILDKVKEEKGVQFDKDLTAEDLKAIVKMFKDLYKKEQGEEFPQEPKVQLIEAVKAVFRSWDNDRANVYRRMHDIPYEWGTAVNVQMMVFGNMGDTSGTGVAFSRNPATGENKLYGEYLMNAQGEDVVAGIRTPQPIASLKKQNPAVYKQFEEIAKKLEKHNKDMQDMEFTIENGKLYMLQTRNGKRTAKAALKVAVDLVKEKLIDEKQALLMLDPKQLDALLHPQFEAAALKKAKVIAEALPASPGAACGKICFTAERAKELGKKQKVVLVRLETSPEDIEGMAASQGILTARGGMTSHAAVVARGMGTACVAGCSALKFADDEKSFTLNGKKYVEGDMISFDGSTGKIYEGEVKTEPATISGEFAKIMAWADKYRALQIRTNADQPADAQTAAKFGAEGIGLCRTEHMFFDAERIPAVREMIVSSTVEERKKALAKLLPMQKKDFKGLYKAMEGKAVTIRFLDPPLHEFLPHEDSEVKALAKEMGLTFARLKQTISDLHEVNPMMGHRGLRLAVTYPEIAEMQTQAVIEAAIEVNKEKGYKIVPEIMIPLTCDCKEFKYVRDIVAAKADEIIAKKGAKLSYKIGTMIEIPRAALTADEVAKAGAEFFSFGTNDLTQMTFGFSRDDAGKFLDVYYTKKIFESDPFARLDQNGVGKLVKMAASLGKEANPDIKLGICGEHGGEPSSVEFCHNVGLTYVSCSPFRVPIARLAAAQANIKNPRK